MRRTTSRIRSWIGLCLIAVCTVSGLSGQGLAVHAQSLPQAVTSTPEAAPVQTVDVVSSRAGPLVWTVENDNARLYLISDISPVPAAAKWDEARVARLVGEAQTVILPHRVRGGLPELLRILTIERGVVFLPGKTHLNDTLSPEDRTRLAAAIEKARGKPKDFEKLRPGFAGVMLTSRFIKSFDLNEGTDPEAFVEKTARKARKKVLRIGNLPLLPLVKALGKAPPESQLACLRHSMSQVERGPDEPRDAAMRWARGQLPRKDLTVTDAAVRACFGNIAQFRDLSTRMEGDWRKQAARAMNTPGVTLMVVPAGALISSQGLLDYLDHEGHTIRGANWR
ncbi:MAG: TraB/GumN family protein [Asticcacaulis sp.]